MMKILPFFILFMFIVTTLAHADVYRCGENDGVTIFTDNPANFSSICREEVVSDVQTLGITPSLPAESMKARASTRHPAAVTEQKQLNNTASPYDTFKNETDFLVGKFTSTRKRVFRSTGSRSRHRAQRELKEIRAQKDLLSSEIDQVTMKRWQKKELRTTLSTISECC